MILVFGKTGQVGSELNKLENVTALSRKDADFFDPSSCSKIIHKYAPSAVINAAGYTSVDEAEKEPENACKINCLVAGEIAYTCKELGIPLVYISTDYVFNGSGNKSRKPEEKTLPINKYGHSKLAGEKAVRKSGAIFAILRTSWVISCHGSNFVKTMLNLSNRYASLSVVNDQIGGPTPARDIAKACVTITYQLLRDPKKSGIYHYSGAPDISWSDFANIIFKLAKINTLVKPIPTSKYPTVALRPLNSRLDCTKTFETFNLVRPEWKKGLKIILDELKVLK